MRKYLSVDEKEFDQTQTIFMLGCDGLGDIQVACRQSLAYSYCKLRLNLQYNILFNSKYTAL